jgi:thymidylate synthase (FAD)
VPCVRIIEPSFELSMPFRSHMNVEDGIRLLQFIETQARISHRSEDKQTEDSWKRFIPAVVLQHGDWSVTEHVSVTATIRTDRGVTHELVRHRLFAFTQESTRFVRYQDGNMEFIAPAKVNPFQMVEWSSEFMRTYEDAEERYQKLIGLGVRPQEARNILPNALAATIAVTGNLRNWRHFFLMRSSRETHPDFRRIADPMLIEFKKIIPLLYDDIEPDQRQIENLRKPR